jgi:plastocyanin
MDKINRREFVRLLLPGALGATLLAACSTENTHFVVKIDGKNSFVPGDLVVPAGSVVTWQNISLLPQTVTCDPTKAQKASRVQIPDNAKPWDSGQLYPGQTWSYTFDTPGSYTYFSRAQESDALLGTVTVTK